MSDTRGKWFADYDGTIKRAISDSEGNHTGYELLSGEYPKEWAAAPKMLDTLKLVAEFLGKRDLVLRTRANALRTLNELIDESIAKAERGVL